MKGHYPGGLDGIDMIQACLLFAVCLLAWRLPQTGAGMARRTGAAIDRIGAKRNLACLVCVLVPIALRLILLPLYPAPLPMNHDEHSFLLQADTFAHGRATNPPPGGNGQFDQQYVLSKPSFQSIYPPAHALELAAGQLVLGSTWAGVVVTSALMFGALCWCLQGWTAPRWAFRAALAAIVTIGPLSYWMNSFWGGETAALAGCLVFGALGRLRKSRGAGFGILWAAGIAIEVNCRPLEGFILAGGSLAYAIRALRPARLRPAFSAAAVTLLAAAFLTLLYNRAVTGSALLAPYVLEQQLAGVPEGFYFQQALSRPDSRWPDIQAEYQRQLDLWRRGRSVKTFVTAAGHKIALLWGFYAGPLLTPALIFVLLSRHRRVLFFPALLIAACMAAQLLYHSYYPHYSAALLGPIALLLVYGWREMAHRGAAGAFLGRALPLVMLLGLLAPVLLRLSGAAPGLWRGRFTGADQRVALLAGLARSPGQKLLFVHYSAAHDPNADWIYNLSNFDEQNLVIARDDGEAANRLIIQRFANRSVLFVDADEEAPRVTGYSVTRSQRPIRDRYIE